MNILIINYEYPPTGAGAARQNYYMAHELIRQGHQAVVLTAAYKNHKGISDENGITLWRIPAIRRKKNQSNMLEMASFVFLAFFYVNKAIRRYKIDKIIVFFSFPCGPIGLWAKWISKVPFIVYLQGSDIPGNDKKLNFLHSLLKPLRLHIYKKSIAVVANSPSAALMASQADNFPVKYIPNAVDTRFFHPLKQTKNENFTYLFVGRLHHEKNIDLLLKGFTKYYAQNQNIKLKIIGQGYLEQEIRNFITKKNMAKAIELLQWQEKEHLPEIYNSAHCFINPSFNEGMPNAVMEAMACGLVPIVSNVPGNKDLVQDKINGLLFENNNQEDFIICLKLIFTDSNLREQLSTNCVSSMQKNFSAESMVRQYLDLIEKG